MGTSPRCSASYFSGSLSTRITSCPSSAKHAPATRPTYPLPITAIRISSPSRVTGAIRRILKPYFNRCPASVEGASPQLFRQLAPNRRSDLRHQLLVIAELFRGNRAMKIDIDYAGFREELPFRLEHIRVRDRNRHHRHLRSHREIKRALL